MSSQSKLGCVQGVRVSRNPGPMVWSTKGVKCSCRSSNKMPAAVREAVREAVEEFGQRMQWTLFLKSAGVELDHLA